VVGLASAVAPNFPDLGPRRQTCDAFRVEIEIDLGENATMTDMTSGQ
jgi:hypothetical protein